MVTSIEDKVDIVQGRHCRAQRTDQRNELLIIWVDYLEIHCHRNGQG